MYCKRKLLPALILLVLPLLARGEVRVFACEPEWAALAREVGGERVEVYSATTAMQDPHRIQARPALIARLRRADLLICTGAQLESGWLPLLLRRARNPAVQPGRPGHLLIADQMRLLERPERLDRSRGDIHAAGNPHVHLDPRRIATAARLLHQRLNRVDAASAGDYTRNLEHFLAGWEAAMADWNRRAAWLRGQRVVVHHRGWSYLLDWLGLTEAGVLEPLPGVPPSATHLAALREHLAGEGVLAILRATYQDARPSQWLSGQTGIPAVALPFTVGGSEDAGDLRGLFEAILHRLEGLRR
ncbi:MAG: zinc ABC transporter substrate-binding protein [Gammaproteobacteria bacterium]|nr:MAG: zinc ABC transporter substrate-binding protein [Gammaproteobacteria bacterium]